MILKVNGLYDRRYDGDITKCPTEEFSSSNIDMNIIIFGGGSAQRAITSALLKQGARVTRAVSFVDDGGSSGLLRDAFGVVPVGDIRNALLGMAIASNGSNRLIEFLDRRLPEGITKNEGLNELENIILMDHQMMKDIDPSSQRSLSKFLTYFKRELDKADFNDKKSRSTLANASIGNLVLMGAYFQYSRNINSAIEAFKRLCDIRGSVWPVSIDGNIYLGAVLEDGSIIIGENNITKRDRMIDKRRIIKIFLTKKNFAMNASYDSVRAVANQEVIREINKANIIIYGPGSFFTSILPHMLVDEIAETISIRNVPKVLIGNICQDNETYNQELVDLVNIFLNIGFNYISEHNSRHLITHILANKPPKNKKHKNKKGYLPIGDLSLLSDEITSIIKNYENPKRKGYHDPVITTEEIIRIWGEGK